MNIDEMSDSEKSVLLARAMGIVEPGPVTGNEWAVIGPVIRLEVLNFYDELNMALAWRVLNWISGEDRETDIHSIKKLPAFLEFDRWWTNKDNFLFQLSPADAQRAWLDKVLSLALAAGLVPELAEEAI